VPDGPLTQHLQKIQPGDTVLMRQKPTGTLVLDALKPGKRLYMIATGTGIAPFASLIRDPETYEKFEAGGAHQHLPRRGRSRLWQRAGRVADQ
jgi:ferredoxin/flavodoxin---NADP+ reductase